MRKKRVSCIGVGCNLKKKGLAKINLRNMIFVVSNLGPFSVSVFFSGKNFLSKI